MPGTTSDDLTSDLIRILLSLTLLLVVKLCIELWVQWATAQAAANDAGVAGNAVRLISSYRRNSELKLTCGGYSVAIAGALREPFVEIIFSIDWSRSAGCTRVQLTLDQVDFGVRNCCTGNCSARNQSDCDKNCKTVFIYKLTIEARPKSWAQDCRRLLLQPHHTAEVFGLQRNSNVSFQMPFVSPRQAAVTYQIGNTVSHGAPAFGWSPARRDAVTNSISWTWELYRYANGGKLEFNQHRWGFRPLLAIRPRHTHISPGSFVAKASWELPPDVDLQQHQLEWDLKITLHTALLQSKRRLPRYLLTMGPTLSFVKLLAFS